MDMNSFRRLAAGAMLMLSASGCSTLGNLDTLGQVLGGVIGGPGAAQQGTVSAEVQQVEANRQLIHVRSQEGQTAAVRYNQSTVVVYQQQQYPVTALERGDRVTMQVQQDAQGNYYTPRIDVVQSVRERGHTPGAGGVHQLAGRVGQIDHNRGVFELHTQHAGTVLVSLPYNPGAATTDRFRRLRSGDSVGIEGEVVGSNRITLIRFL
jgi:hypothetical protein